MWDRIITILRKELLQVLREPRLRMMVMTRTLQRMLEPAYPVVQILEQHHAQRGSHGIKTDCQPLVLAHRPQRLVRRQTKEVTEQQPGGSRQQPGDHAAVPRGDRRGRNEKDDREPVVRRAE